jgi:hypothetical protein
VGAREHPLGGGHRLLRLIRSDPRRRAACLFDQPLTFGVSRRQHRASLLLDAGQFGLDLLRVGQSARNLLAPCGEHPQNRLVGEEVEHDADNPEADRLRNEMRPIDPERVCD